MEMTPNTERVVLGFASLTRLGLDCQGRLLLAFHGEWHWRSSRMGGFFGVRSSGFAALLYLSQPPKIDHGGSTNSFSCSRRLATITSTVLVWALRRTFGSSSRIAPRRP